MYNMLFRLVRNRATAEDLLQDAFVKVFSNLKKYDNTKPFEPWL
ncbi:MAG: sigma-70 family RNA polymerase sigma factor, partial [Bacteroidetes bacterium]|nr:sigma-70 family RNA polymerase sigma factor [Bacteroidota bacterium]